MRVFVTGATGFVGSAVAAELAAAGHEVTGLARSGESAAALTAAGIGVHRGSLDDLESLRAGAAAADGIVHTAFVHDFSDFFSGFAAANKTDRLAVETIAETLAGSNRPLIVTSGTAALIAGRVAAEDSDADPASPALPRFETELAALAYAGRGVRVSVLRLPPSVHGEGDHGFVPTLIDTARATGVAGYPGDGTNRWATVHRLDVARLYRLALENAPAGSRLHGIGEEGVTSRQIAEAFGKKLGLPVTSIPRADAEAHFGFLGGFFSLDVPASSEATQRLLDWRPAGPGLLDDLAEDHYFSRAV